MFDIDKIYAVENIIDIDLTKYTMQVAFIEIIVGDSKETFIIVPNDVK